jgi:hypothetical protein
VAEPVDVESPAPLAPSRSARDAAPLEVEVAVLDAAPARVTEAEPLDVEAADALMG